MRDMMEKDYLSEIDERFPVRNSAEEKETFRKWALAEATGSLRAVREENDGHVNLIFGDPAAARVIFTAHYDTPRRGLVPNLMLVTNPVLSFGYKLGIPLVMLGIAVGAAFGAKALLGLDFELIKDRILMLAVYMAVYFGLFYLLLRGPANPHNRNDNTSGTAAVMEILRRQKEGSRIACILFDDEEKGKKGSKAYAAAHPDIKESTLIVNLDCVGNGDCAVFSVSDGAESSPLCEKLREAVSRKGLKAEFFSSRRARMNSDHKSFSRSIGVCVCSRSRLAGYYTGRIHTARDTVAEPETVLHLAETLSDFAGRI